MYNLVQEANKRLREHCFAHSFTRQLANCNGARIEEAEDLYHLLILNTRTYSKKFPYEDIERMKKKKNNNNREKNKQRTIEEAMHASCEGS